MNDEEKTRDQLVSKLAELRRRIADLETAEVERDWAFRVIAEHTEILHAFPDLYFRLDPDGIIVDCNAGKVSELNLSPKGLLGRRLQEVLPRDIGQMFEETISQVFDTQSLATIEFPLTLPIGGRKFEARLMPLLSNELFVVVRDNTEQKHMEGALQDTLDELEGRVEERNKELRHANEYLQREISGRQVIEEAMRKSEELLKGLVEHLPDGVCLLRPDKQLILANKLGEAYLTSLAEYRADESIASLGGHEIERLLKPREDGLAHELVLEGSTEKIFEVECHTTGSELEDVGWLVVIRDVTRERETQLRIQLRDRLAAVGQLAAGIAHDFNNLLTVITGFADLLKMRKDTPESIKDTLKTIVTQGDRAAQLIRQILDFSRKTVAQRQPIDLASFLKEAIKMLERTLPETMRVTTELGETHCVVEGNLTQLQQVVTNLAVNARDAMPDGGDLRIQLSRLRLGSGESMSVRPHSRTSPNVTSGDWIVLAVSDTGSGMTPDVKDHLFEPFFTTKSQGEGTGLGLAQVYGIVKQHEGYIDVESDLGKGTTFRIYLPEVAGEGAPLEVSESRILSGSGETILVVEDEDDVLNVLKTMLEGLNYKVLSARDGLQALSLFDEHEDSIRLVLTDMVMPGMGGKKLVEALKARNPDLRIVVMTGYRAGMRGEISEQVDGLLEKPMRLEQVARALRNALPEEESEE